MSKKNATPKWGYLALPHIVPFHFAEGDKTHLQQILAEAELGAIAGILIPELEEQLSYYLAYATIEMEYPKRSEIMSTLSVIETLAGELEPLLRHMDKVSRQTIASFLPELPFGDDIYYESDGDYILALAERLENLRGAVGLVWNNHDSTLPSAKNGLPESPARRTLAENVAKLFFNHTGTLPSATRDGMYESVLICCINTTTVSDLMDIHDLASEALNAVRVEIPSQ